jgi:hypothetical protein
MDHLALVLYLTLFGADGASTHVALARPNAHELFLTQRPSINDALIAGQAAGLYALTARIQNPRVRWTVRLVVAGVHGAAALYNVRQLHEGR